MNVEEAKKQLEDSSEKLKQAMDALGDGKTMLLAKLEPLENKKSSYNDEEIIATITKGGVVMIQFVTIEEAKKYYDKL